MNTHTEGPVATPKKGAVKPQGSWDEQENSSGRFVAVSEGTRKAKVVAVKKDTRKAKVRMLLFKVTGVPSGDRPTMLANIRKGLSYRAIEDLEVAYGASRKELATVLSIPSSTMTRRKKEGRLHVDESDRVARFARIKDAAVEMMQGDDDAAISWLHTPLEILGNESPMMHASTEMGARDVEDLIGRIRHGVFS